MCFFFLTHAGTPGIYTLSPRDALPICPWGALSANLRGCLAMGVVAQLVASAAWFNEAGIVPDQYRLLFAIGFCGSFTTLSALVMELHTMLHRNEILSSFSYLMATMLGGFACFYLGFVITRLLRL
mgnify:CR=1 FL=1